MKSMDWQLYRINNLGEEVEVDYGIEFDLTPGEEAYISGPPEKCYPGSPPEFDVCEIWLQEYDQNGNLVRTKLDPKNWEAVGFTDKELEKIQEKAFEEANEPEDDGDRSYDAWKDSQLEKD
jgi:hypothetical protein